MDVHLIGLDDIGRQQAPPGVLVPRSFYQVLAKPAPMAGMSYPPAGFPWGDLHALGYQALARLEPAEIDTAPVRLLFDQPLEDLWGGRPPTEPEREEVLVRDVTARIADALYEGEGVVVHCHGGTGRTGLVIGCVLVRLGLDLQRIRAYLDALMKQRDRDGWPESSWQAEVLQRYTNSF